MLSRFVTLAFTLAILGSGAITTRTDQAIAPDGTQVVHRQTTLIFDYSMPMIITKPKRMNTEVIY